MNAPIKGVTPYPWPATYRYTLTRSWGGSSDWYDGRACWVMLNPSTADEHLDDPTIRRVVRFSEDHGFAELIVVNLYAVRSTDPKHLEMFEDPVGPDNDVVMVDAMRGSDRVVFAWGASLPCRRDSRCGRAFDFAEQAGHVPVCLGRTKGGHPRHPLYVPAKQRFEVF